MRRPFSSPAFSISAQQDDSSIHLHAIDDSKNRTCIHPDERITFHLGITMAGAVSGGAYIAGAMDYLLDTLKTWEDLRQKNISVLESGYDDWKDAVNTKGSGYNVDVPMHSVIIEVIGGASAGSISAVLTALSLFHKKRPRDTSDEPDKNSIAKAPDKQKNTEVKGDTFLYDAWVRLAEDERNSDSTFVQMLDIKDLEDAFNVSNLQNNSSANIPDNVEEIASTGIQKKKASFKFPNILSLLNNTPLQNVKQRILESWTDSEDWQSSQCKKKPAFASANLDLILTLTSLRALPIKFSLSPRKNSDEISNGPVDEKPWHVMNLHRLLAHFRIDSGNAEPDPSIIALDTSEKNSVASAFTVALASGAFPIGLPPAFVGALDAQYIQQLFEQLYNLKDNPLSIKNHIEIPETEFVNDGFDFVAVDGGVMNNDPFGEVSTILAKKISIAHALEESDQETNVHLTANIFIDPFPNFYKHETYAPPKNIIGVAKQLIGAMLGQSRIKNEELLHDFVGSGGYGMIFPSYNEGPGEINSNPLATGGIEGFAGLISFKLRKFDYQLGRRNCQSFLQHYFYFNETGNANPDDRLSESIRDEVFKKSQEKISSLFAYWNDDVNKKMKTRFGIIDLSKNESKNGVEIDPSNVEAKSKHNFHIPIIPDFSIEKQYLPPDQMTRLPVDESLWYMSPDLIDKLKEPIRLRVQAMYDLLLKAFMREQVTANKSNVIYSTIFSSLCVALLFILISEMYTPILMHILLGGIGALLLAATAVVLFLRYRLLPNLITSASTKIQNAIKTQLIERDQFDSQNLCKHSG